MSTTSVVIPAKAGNQTVHLICSVDARSVLMAFGLGPRLRGDDKGREQR